MNSLKTLHTIKLSKVNTNFAFIYYLPAITNFYLPVQKIGGTNRYKNLPHTLKTIILIVKALTQVCFRKQKLD